MLAPRRGSVSNKRMMMMRWMSKLLRVWCYFLSTFHSWVSDLSVSIVLGISQVFDLVGYAYSSNRVTIIGMFPFFNSL